MARKLAFDRVLFVTGVGLALFGLVMIFSASGPLAMENYKNSYHFLIRQAAAFVLGLAGMGVAMNLDYRDMLKRPVVMAALLGSTLLLAGVLVADRAHMVHRWIRLGPIQIQPSEIAKIALVLYLAYQMARREDEVNDVLRTILPIGVVVGQLAVLVYLEPDLGTATLYAMLAGVVLFLAGLRWRYLALAGGAGVGALAMLILAAPYRLRRITAFLHPDDDPLGAGFQVRQSIVAVASGGVHGTSLGEGRQKLFFLPEPHTDFIFAVTAEELGLLGATVVVALFVIFLYRAIRTAVLTDDIFARYLATGIGAMVGVQALFNISVVLGMAPTKGIPLPFISYGGSSLFITLASVGVLLNITQHTD